MAEYESPEDEIVLETPDPSKVIRDLQASKPHSCRCSCNSNPLQAILPPGAKIVGKMDNGTEVVVMPHDQPITIGKR